MASRRVDSGILYSPESGCAEASAVQDYGCFSTAGVPVPGFGDVGEDCSFDDDAC
jgi:hypothetical protein